MAPKTFGQVAGSKNDNINVALLGSGAQGQVLRDACLRLGRNSGVPFQSVCDIWEAHNLGRMSRTLKVYQHAATPYVDYQETL